MSKQIRAFIAVKIAAPPSLRKVISRLSRMGRPIKACDVDALHVTLKFLGDTSLDAIPELAAGVAEVAGAAAPFAVRLSGVGAFPNSERPTVVWAGLVQAESLIRLVSQLESRVAPLGLPPEHRDFRPHLTLARVKSRPPADLFQLLQEHAETDFGVAHLDSIEILQSELRPEGPRYSLLARADFTGG
ncbi:MAG: RNA 2',3'-cyclic phosphodiesterase [Planctomycetaceae bacterium]